jgi:hypothetical protein
VTQIGSSASVNDASEAAREKVDQIELNKIIERTGVADDDHLGNAFEGGDFLSKIVRGIGTSDSSFGEDLFGFPKAEIKEIGEFSLGNFSLGVGLQGHRFENGARWVACVWKNDRRQINGDLHGVN